MPRPAITRIAGAAPISSASRPIARTPSGPVPMHIVTMPMTRDVAAAGASVKTRLVCIVAKAAVPRPPITSSMKASPYHGDNAIATTPARNRNEPRNKARLPLSRIHPADSAMPLAIAPSGSAPASAPTKVGDTP